MPKKGDRTIAPRILHVLDENLGVGMRFAEISRALAEHHWHHGDFPISDNVRYLVKEKKIVRVENQYCLVKTRKNGSKFVIVKDPVENEKVVDLIE